MKKQTNSKGNQLYNTFENWLNGKVEYEISRFSPEESKRIHAKSKELLITEADNQFKKEKDRIEKSLLSVPSKEKFIQSEIDIIYRILHKNIDYRNDCKKGGLNADVVYYKTGQFEYDIKQIESIRHNYRIYLRGEINYIGKTPEIDFYRAGDIIEAIKFFKFDEWLKVLRESKTVNKEPIIEKERLALIYRKYKTDEAEKKYPDKYYAWYHKILIAKGKAEQFTPGAKQEIIDYGKNRYGTKGHGFYQAFMEFDLTSRLPFVNDFSLKERKKWKERIIEISNNDIDVINYLKDFPN